MNFVGPYSDYYPNGFWGAAGYCRHGLESPVSMRKIKNSAGFPIALDEIMADLRVDSPDEAQTVARMARTAAAFLEKRTGFAIVQGTYEAKFSQWNILSPWEFMRAPFRELLEVSWLDGTQSPPTWEAVDNGKFFVSDLEKSFLCMPLQGASSAILPTIWAPFHGIRVRFNAGFDIVLTSDDPVQESGDGPPDDAGADVSLEIPDDLRTTITMLTGHFYENRELFAADKIAEVEMSAGSLLASNRQFW
jgi:hypothetical protein